MRRVVWGLATAALIVWSATCGGIAVMDEPREDGPGPNTTTTTTGPSVIVAQNASVGPSTSSIGTTTSGPSDPCPQMPDYQACANCYCQADPDGCEAYYAVLIGHFYCGVTCSMTCAEFCAEPNTTPSPECENCVVSIDCSSPPPGSPEE